MFFKGRTHTGNNIKTIFGTKILQLYNEQYDTFHERKYEGVSKSFQTESITK